MNIGIDLIEVARVAEKIGKEQGFRELVFSENEIAYCESKTHPMEHYAARFAAKEAFLKAAGTGWTEGVAFNEIEILNTPNGQPELHLCGKTAQWASQMQISRVSVSLSHLKSVASAAVIIEKS
jgi:holo-[acyl-carrier protein] synthase